VGGGQAYDVLIDTTDVPGDAPYRTYYLYTTDLSELSNGPQERGGIMTEIRISN
jgi:hypothetical protein